jgi:hypothetical protein
MTKTFSEKILRKSTRISISVFPRLPFVLSRFQVLLSDGSSKAPPKKNQKDRVKKFFLKQKIDKKSQNRLFLGFCLSRFWAFFGEGSLKTRQKPSKKIGPGTFLASEEPTN